MSERMTEERYADLMRLPADSFLGIERELLREIAGLRDDMAEIADALCVPFPELATKDDIIGKARHE